MQKRIFGLIGIALVVAVVASLTFGSVALADDGGDTKVVVTFNGENPDIDISIHKEIPYGGYHSCELDTWFHLDGSSHAEGGIAGYAESGTRNRPIELGANFIGTGSSFEWQFGSSVTSGDTVKLLNVHGGDVTGSSLDVSGGAYANGGWSYEYKHSNAGQSFSGEAESGDFYGGRYWNYGTDTEEGAFAEFNMESDSPAAFEGSTDSRWYGATWGGGEGLGFGINASFSINDALDTNYPYTSVLAFEGGNTSIGTQITFDEGWAIIEAFNADHIVGETATWDGYPGYTNPMP